MLTNGPYTLLPDGRLRFVDRACATIATFSVTSDQPTVSELAFENCNVDERIAHETLFGLASPFASSAR